MGDAPVELVERAACPVCGARPGTPLLALSYAAPPLDRYLLDFYAGRLDPARLVGQFYRLVECASCSLVYQRDVPPPDFLAELYGVVVDEPEEVVQRRRDFAVRRAYAIQVEQVIRHWNLPPVDLEVLDFGAGSGMWLRFAQAYGCRTAAVEPSADGVVAGADRTYASDCLPDATFHYVNAEQVFEHLVDPAVELAHIARSLRPGGIVRISVPSANRLDRALEAADWAAPKGTALSLNAVAPLEHLNCYVGGSLGRLGASAGLESFRHPIRTHLRAAARPSEVVAALRERTRSSGGVRYFRRP